MTPLQITYEGGLTPSEALTQRIQQEAKKLDRFRDRITSCRVAVIGRPGRRRHGDLYAVHLQISVPGQKDIVIDRNPPMDHAHEDAYVTVRDAFRAARRRLQDRHRRQQGKVKFHEEPTRGRIARLPPEKDYGFIAADDGREIYFHINAVTNSGPGLQPGARVTFIETNTDSGVQATTVRIVAAEG